MCDNTVADYSKMAGEERRKKLELFGLFYLGSCYWDVIRRRGRKDVHGFVERQATKGV